MHKTVLVFSSNERGSHCATAASLAIREFGAKPGHAEGLQGCAYSIPTHDDRNTPLPCGLIETSVRRFIKFADKHPDLLFEVTPLDADLPSETRRAIETLLAGAPANCFITPHQPMDRREARANQQA